MLFTSVLIVPTVMRPVRIRDLGDQQQRGGDKGQVLRAPFAQPQSDRFDATMTLRAPVGS
jgi:hypothetical protein